MKKLGLLILLGILLSSFQGCKDTNVSAIEGNNSNGITKNNNSKSESNLKLSEKTMQTEFKKLDGSTAKIEDFKGKVILVNIWGTWCGPCKMEIPELIKLKEEFGEKGFEVIGLNTGYGGEFEPESVVKAFIENTKINYEIGFAAPEIVMEMSKISQRSAVPMTFVFNKKSEIVGIFTGFNPQTTPPKLKTTIEKALNQES
jgi:thiol-disulfide isomerase/thioredoxin